MGDFGKVHGTVPDQFFGTIYFHTIKKFNRTTMLFILKQCMESGTACRIHRRVSGFLTVHKDVLPYNG